MATMKVRGMKYILSACPIHRGCAIELVFGDDADRRIPFPDPTVKQIAERDFPDLVPIEAKHLQAKPSGRLAGS
jgi:hypothetical protein